MSGQRAEAEKVVTELQETAKRRYVSPYDVAALTAGLGEKEQALGYEDRSDSDKLANVSAKTQSAYSS